MRARIYQPAKTAMQSGRAMTQGWILEFEPAQAKTLEPLMGWAGSGDTMGQVQLHFDSQDAAAAYAAKHGIDYDLFEPPSRQLQIKAYADNFRSDRISAWTH